MQLASLGPHGYDINIRMWIPHSYCDISDISAIPAYKLFFNASMAASKGKDFTQPSRAKTSHL